jgi:hypothetical protein
VKQDAGKTGTAHFDVNLTFLSVSVNLEGTIFLLFVESTELTFFLPIVDRPDEDDDEDSDDDGHTFHEIDFSWCTPRLRIFGGRTRDSFIDTDILV